MTVQVFYNEVTQAIRFVVDAMIGETLMNKMEDEAYNLTEEMLLNNCQWPNKRTPSKKVAGEFHVLCLSIAYR